MPPIMHYKRSRNGGPHSAISGQSVDGVPSKENKTETSCGKRAGECSRRYSEKSGPRMIDNRQRTLTTHDGNKFQDKDFVYDTTTNKQYSIGQRRYSDPRLQLDNKMVRSLIRHVIALIALVVLLLAVLTVGGGVLMWKVVQLSDEMLKAGIESQNLSLHSNLTLSPLDPTAIRDCYDVKLLGYRKTGAYRIYVKDDINATEVYCDLDNAGGGWTVLLRRKDNSENFDRGWKDYRNGFGNLEGEFWAGNELFNKMTNSERTYSLRVDMMSFEGDILYAEYKDFSVSTESDFYRLHVSGYSGTAGNSLQYHDKCRFSTREFDNDVSSQHCAKVSGSPWWFNSCQRVLLTGQYGAYPGVDGKHGISWKEPWGTTKFAKFVEMKVRPNSPVDG